LTDLVDELQEISNRCVSVAGNEAHGASEIYEGWLTQSRPRWS
jgi:hypothetical protein